LALTSVASMTAGKAMGSGHHLRDEVGQRYQHDKLSWIV
jgi:hypothetical protein